MLSVWTEPVQTGLNRKPNQNFKPAKLQFKPGLNRVQTGQTEFKPVQTEFKPFKPSSNQFKLWFNMVLT